MTETERHSSMIDGARRSVIEKIDHVCVAVRSIESAARLFVDILGAQFLGGGDNTALDVRAVQLRMPPGIKVELLQPLTPDSWMARFIDRNGEGFHHMTAYTDDVLEVEKRLHDRGFETVDTDVSNRSWQETFTRPSTTFGALIQLANPSDPWDEPIPGITLADVAAGKIRVLSNVVTWMDSGEVIWPRPS